jgi:gamma-glutamylcyclotransferase (GGCT)/AIG2-like uncharacterized protein YtfP
MQLELFEDYTTPPKKHLVFVYGSLMYGHGNHHLLMDNTFIGDYLTASDNYYMYSLGGYPGVTKGGAGKVLGELYEVDDTTLESLDMLEGNGSFYTRELVDLDGYDDPVWMYILPEDYATRYGSVKEKYTHCVWSWALLKQMDVLDYVIAFYNDEDVRSEATFAETIN